MDGWITIGTDIDSQKFDKELKRLEKESEQFAKEEEKLLNKKAKLELDTSKTINELSKVDKKIDLISNKMKKMEENNLPENLKVNDTYQKLNVQVDSLISKSQEYANKLELQKNHLTGINEKLKLNASNQEMVKNKIEETEAKSLGLHMNFDSIGKSIWDNVKKVGKWAAAVFSIRTAYSLVRQAMSTISTYNDDINNKLYSTKMMFTSALEPVVTRIVNLVWRLMSYVAYIAKAWFGVDLLTKSSANSMKSGAKSAKEMKKAITGFDEANILNDNGTTGAVGASTPKFVMPDEGKMPSWIDWIAKNKDKLLTFIKTFTTLLGVAFGTKAIINFLSKLKSVRKILDLLNSGIGGLVGLLKGMSGLQIFVLIAGVVVTLTGIATMIKGIVAFIKDSSWENFNKILEGLTLTLLGVGAAMIALNKTNPVGWIVLAAGAITGLVTGLSTLAQKLFTNKANIKSVEQAQKDLKKAQEELKEATTNLTSATKNYEDAVKNAENASKKLAEAERKNKISGEELFKQVLDGKLKYQDMNRAQKEVYNSYINNLDAQEKLKYATDELSKSTDIYKEKQQEEIKQNWEEKLSVAEKSKEYDNFKKSVIDAYNSGELKAEEARDYIERAMTGMSESSKKTFTQDLPSDIKKGLDPDKYESTWSKFKKSWDGFFDKLGNAFSKVWNTITSKASKGVFVPVTTSTTSNIGTVNKRNNAKGAIVYPKLQYHASGGIINQPGRGVPITQHVGGEAGPEGIVPLTDSQQMDLLGQAIARYMVINATIPVSINGRVFAREMKKVETQRDFATNR